ncbi:aldehyde dehydrogenase [Vararia minispora EC-137]|uniref:Aldehyde dehydrogenase n=1 Tax=Vararia minispora EC-137 TaxID=1314806 RepID=A0ACB8QGX9_9AGAM|nr:aldehyde dehydrogenase [Vararia minispora EC-137]
MAGTMTYTSLEDIQKVHRTVTETFHSGLTQPLAFRRAQLVQLGKLIQENEARFLDAMQKDLGKAPLETGIADAGPVVYSIAKALEKLDEWNAPDRPADLPAWRAGWDTTVYKTPKGAVLIITPWNYPYVIGLGPLVGAIAAGCTAALKPSEALPTVCEMFAELFPRYLDTRAYAIVKGAVRETTCLLEHRWDHIFYTGSTRVGRIVAAAAARFVTPLTLELGGKCPVVVADDTDIAVAARRILYGKQANAGQVCVSPDYVLVPRARQDELLDAFAKVAAEFWPDGSLASPDLANVINAAARDRLTGLLAKTRGKVALGGEVEGDRRLAVTIVRDVPEDDILMEDEIFGPVLAVVPVDDVEHALRLIRAKPTPLAIYVYTESDALKQRFLETTESGTLVLNDTYQQLAVQEMPFGGKGDSGYGAWFGKDSFDIFVQRRSYVNVPIAADPHLAVRYPPYTQEKLDILAGFGLRMPLPKE